MGLKTEMLDEWARGGKAAPEMTIHIAADADFRRVRSTMHMACYSEQIPRRLGQTATADDLRRDKRSARQVQTIYLALWRQHAEITDEYFPPPEFKSKRDREKFGREESGTLARRAGAIVDWQPWCEQRVRELELRCCLLADLAVREGQREWGWTYCFMIQREAEGLARIANELRGRKT